MGGARITSRAFEFLHNTFGEYLVAYYILIHLRSLISELAFNSGRNRSRAISSFLDSDSEWYVSLVYSPLFTRPLIVNMLQEWSEDCFLEDSSVKRSAISEHLNRIVASELKSCWTGEAMIRISEFVKSQNNPFNYDDLMRRLATYSVNLAILRATVLVDNSVCDFRELCGQNGWTRLTHLWRSAFSLDELSALSACFNMYWIDGTLIWRLKYSSNHAPTVTMNENQKQTAVSSALEGKDDVGYTVQDILTDTQKQLAVNSVLGNKDDVGYALQYILNEIGASAQLPGLYRNQLNNASPQIIYHLCKLVRFGIITCPPGFVYFLSSYLSREEKYIPNELCREIASFANFMHCQQLSELIKIITIVKMTIF